MDSTRVKRVRFAVDTQTSNDNDSFNMNYLKMLENMTYDDGENPKNLAPNLVKYHLNTLTLTAPYFPPICLFSSFRWKYRFYSILENVCKR